MLSGWCASPFISLKSAVQNHLDTWRWRLVRQFRLRVWCFGNVVSFHWDLSPEVKTKRSGLLSGIQEYRGKERMNLFLQHLRATKKILWFTWTFLVSRRTISRLYDKNRAEHSNDRHPAVQSLWHYDKKSESDMLLSIAVPVTLELTESLFRQSPRFNIWTSLIRDYFVWIRSSHGKAEQKLFFIHEMGSHYIWWTLSGELDFDKTCEQW